MDKLLGIDLGTSYFKAGVFSVEGELLGLGRCPMPGRRTPDGRHEMHPGDFWAVLGEAVRQAITDAGIQPRDIAAVSYSSQASTFILLDAKHQPLTPFIVWDDARMEEVPPPLGEFWQRPNFLATTGLGMTGPLFTPAKLFWMREQQPEIWQRACHFRTLTDYLVESLTGQALGDLSTASLLGLADLRNGNWWGEALKLCGLKPGMMVQPQLPGCPAGPLTGDGARRIHLEPGTRLHIGALDHYCAALGAGLDRPGDAIDSNGTVLACGCLTEDYLPLPDTLTTPARHPGQYFQLTFDNAGASRLEQYRDQHAPDLGIGYLVDRAEALYRAKEACGTHAEPHAVEVFEILQANARLSRKLLLRIGNGQPPRSVLATGGGAQSPFWLELKSRELGVEYRSTDIQEAAVRGAALLTRQ